MDGICVPPIWDEDYTARVMIQLALNQVAHVTPQHHNPLCLSVEPPAGAIQHASGERVGAENVQSSEDFRINIVNQEDESGSAHFADNRSEVGKQRRICHGDYYIPTPDVKQRSHKQRTADRKKIYYPAGKSVLVESC